MLIELLHALVPAVIPAAAEQSAAESRDLGDWPYRRQIGARPSDSTAGAKVHKKVFMPM
jgi:hypothetical protein